MKLRIIAVTCFVFSMAFSSWPALAEGVQHIDGKVKAMVFDPTDGTTLYVGSSSGIYRITNIYQNPKLEPIGLPGIEINSLLFDVSEKAPVLYVGTFAWGLYRVVHQKTRWDISRVSEIGNTGVNHLTFDLNNPQTMYAATNKKLFKSSGLPRRFVEMPNLPDDIVIHMLMLDPAAPEVMRLKGYNCLYYISYDGGKTWQTDPSVDAYLHSWQVMLNGVSMSTNTDQERSICWSALAVMLTDSFTSIEILRSDLHTLIIGTFGNGVTKATRNHNTWLTSSMNGLDRKAVFSTLVAEERPLHIFAGLANDIMYTIDEGQTWNSIFK